MSRTILLFGASLAVLLALLKWVEYQFFARDLTLEMYIGIVGMFCMVLGGWIGWKLTRPGKKGDGVQESGIPSVPFTGKYEPDNLYGLSPREYEVLQLIALGHSYQEIADHLCVSLSTVKTHASNLFSKMDVQRKTQAVMLAQKSGLLPPAKG